MIVLSAINVSSLFFLTGVCFKLSFKLKAEQPTNYVSSELMASKSRYCLSFCVCLKEVNQNMRVFTYSS